MATLIKKRLLLIILCSILPLVLLNSCNDSKLAKEVVGTWKLKISVDEGSEHTYYHFNENGMFTETTYYYLSEVGDGIEVVVKYASTITGTWEVLVGDLDLTYDVSTLKVNYLGMKFPGSTGFEENFANALMESLFSDLIKESKDELYDIVEDYYCEETVFANITISGNKMKATIGDETHFLNRVDDSKE